MPSKDELASAAGRRPVGAAAVSRRHWAGFGGTVLEARATQLSPVDPETDAAGLFEASIQGREPERLWDYLAYGPFPSVASTRVWLEDCARSTDPVFVVYRDKETGQPGGMGSFMEIRPTIGVAEIGNIWFGRGWQRDFRASEVLSLMMHHVLETCSYRRLEWKCNALNSVSRAAALRLGFRYEGEFQNHLVVKGHNRDTAWFSITDEEWPGVRAAHESWFSAVYGDASFRQQESLRVLTRKLW